MGLFSWLFPSAEDRLNKAKAMAAKGRLIDARHEALEAGELAGVAELISDIDRQLTQKNLDAAISWATAGDEERVQIHLDLARQYRQPGMDDAFASARAEIRSIRNAAEAKAKAAARAEAERLMEVSEGFRSSEDEIEVPLPEGLSEDEADALKARLALLMEGYPESLRSEMLSLGPNFAQAVLDLDDGKFEDALRGLISLPDDVALVQHERARAAQALGDPSAAARSWRRFAEIAGGHLPIANSHSAVLLAQAMAQTGDLKGALHLLVEERKTDPDLASPLYANLLEALGHLKEAEKVLHKLIKQYPGHMDFYYMIARVRLKSDHRDLAVQAMETGLTRNTCAPGTCGYKPPHLATHRLLATLYFEDGKQLERATELAGIARGLVKKPIWDDLYLSALEAKANHRPESADLVTRLREVTPPGTPMEAKISQHFG